MSVSINTLGNFHQVGNGNYRTLSMEDVIDQTRFTSNANETWQEENVEEECNNYIEEYE